MKEIREQSKETIQNPPNKPSSLQNEISNIAETKNINIKKISEINDYYDKDDVLLNKSVDPSIEDLKEIGQKTKKK